MVKGMLKKILFTSILCISTTIFGAIATPTATDLKTVSSKAYVDTAVATTQVKIPAAGQPNVGAGETVMTYTANGNGEIGERGLYSDTSSYNAATDGDKLITASALNATFTNLPTTDTTKLECANENDGCTLWSIIDQTAYSLLPVGYTQLEYIESTGSQYIDTGVVQDSLDFIVDIDASFAVDDVRMLFGVSSLSPMYFGRATNRKFEMQQQYTSLVVSTDTRVNIKWGKNQDNSKMFLDVTVGGQSEKLISRDSCSITNHKFLLFANNNNSGISGILNGKLYSAKIYKNNNLVRNFVPAKDTSNVVGMYDTVTGTFFTNAAASGDDFTAGPEI